MKNVTNLEKLSIEVKSKACHKTADTYTVTYVS